VNENDLREAMRASLTLTTPPPMESAAALAAGRRAVRRRVALTGGGAAAVMIAVTALAVNSGLHVSADGNAPWAGQPSAAPTGTPSTDEHTKPAWPLDGDGQPQEDATARAGERYDQGKKLLEQVLTAVPDGWTTPTGTVDDEIPLQYHQAAVEGDNTGSTWGYSANAAVAKDGRTGRLLADVHTAGNGLPKDPCPLAQKFWDLGGTCSVVTVGKAKVGVVTLPAGRDRVDQWAAYRHADGVVVYLAQSRSAANIETDLEPLTKLPLSKQQLAALAVDDRFHLN
jgi:hypothetical protein